MTNISEKFNISFDAFDNLPDLYFLLSGKLEIVAANNSVAKLVGQNKCILANKFETILIPSSVVLVENTIRQAIKENKTKKCEAKLTIDSKQIDALLFISPYIDNRNKRILIIAQDITGDKRKEIDLLRFYYVAQNTVNPLQITDTSGKMIYVNPAFEKASGYSKEELLGQNPNIFSSKRHSQKFWDGMWNEISAGKVWIGEVENKRKDGESFFTELLISPILDYQSKVIGYFGIHRDLTEKRALEKQLMHTQKMESIGTLAAGIAHEVGNPLASISALVQIIQRQSQDQFINEKLELVKKQITRISKIIRDLVDFSRPTRYELQLVNLNENLVEAIDIVRVGKKAKNILFLSNLDENLPKLPLVSDQIQQVFVNILINAVDAITDRQLSSPETINGEIVVDTSFLDDSIFISFTDNGIGIPENNVSKIFEPFFTSKKDGKGTGLGLWVSYGIIKSFHGDIKVESSRNNGTTFKISLPLMN
ncbi:MAG: PAS domain S-box protein [Ignavibacteriales bacterium]|nr:PAS domain S-box protein [Ignavibacteriales bacterium]